MTTNAARQLAIILAALPHATYNAPENGGQLPCRVLATNGDRVTIWLDAETAHLTYAGSPIGTDLTVPSRRVTMATDAGGDA